MAEGENTSGKMQHYTTKLRLSERSMPASSEVELTLAYKTFGSASNPAVLMPTCFGGSIASTTTWLYQRADGGDDDCPFPPEKFFVIVVGLLGGGESSSPSNTGAPHDGPRFPRTTYADNVRLQQMLCTARLGLRTLFAYVGFSMGGQQAYHMAALFPGFAERAVCLAGSARTSPHNFAFLDGPRAALVASAGFCAGDYPPDKPPVAGLVAFARGVAAWVLGREWFRQRAWERRGLPSLEAYLAQEDRDMLAMDANDLLAMLWTWQHGDITVYDERSTPAEAQRGEPKQTQELGVHSEDIRLAAALRRITTPFLLLPIRTDAYFPPEDNEVEVQHLVNGRCVVVESIYGHSAGGGDGTDEDCRFIAAEISKFLLATSETSEAF